MERYDSKILSKQMVISCIAREMVRSKGDVAYQKNEKHDLCDWGSLQWPRNSFFKVASAHLPLKSEQRI